jgi:hypothetical protein
MVQIESDEPIVIEAKPYAEPTPASIAAPVVIEEEKPTPQAKITAPKPTKATPTKVTPTKESGPEPKRRYTPPPIAPREGLD